MNTPNQAALFTLISNAWAASTGSDTASPATGPDRATAAGWAGIEAIPPLLRGMAEGPYLHRRLRADRRHRHLPRREGGQRHRLPEGGGGLLPQSGHHRQPGDDGDANVCATGPSDHWHGVALQGQDLCRGLQGSEPQAYPHQTLHAQNQRQGLTLAARSNQWRGPLDIRTACANGPTPGPTRPQTNANDICPNGAICTIGTDRTQR